MAQICLPILPVQRVNVNKQKDGSWTVGVKVCLKHSGHEIGPEVYSSYSFTKKLTQEDIEFVLLMAKAGTLGLYWPFWTV